MTRDKRIAELAGVEVLDMGSVSLVLSTTANRVIDFCEANSICIIGIDGFRTRDTTVMPDMDAIADFSGTSVAESARLSRQFVTATMKPGLWYEFVFEGDD